MIRILGIGNRMYGDDGIGPCIAYTLAKCASNHSQIDIIPLDLPSHGDISLFAEPETIILIDSSPDAETIVYHVNPENLGELEKLELAQQGAGHNISSITLIALADNAGLLREKEIYLILVGPCQPEFGTGLSPQGILLAEKAVMKLKELMGELGIGLKIDYDCVRSLLSGTCSDPLSPLEDSSARRLW